MDERKLFVFLYIYIYYAKIQRSTANIFQYKTQKVSINVSELI